MPRQTVILAVALALASILTIFAAFNFGYLERGYDLRLVIAGGTRSDHHIDFPIWRRITNVTLWIAACGCVWLFYVGQRSTVFSTILVIIVTLMVGAGDIYNYGSIGSPTSFWTVVTLLMLIAAARFRPYLLGFGA